MKGQRTRGRFGIRTNKTLRRTSHNSFINEREVGNLLDQILLKLTLGDNFHYEKKSTNFCGEKWVED